MSEGEQGPHIDTQRDQQCSETSLSSDDGCKELKREYGSMLASSFKHLAEVRQAFATIERRLTKPVRLDILERLGSVESVLAETRMAVQQEDVRRMLNLGPRIETLLLELEGALHPQIERLQHEIPQVLFSSRHGKREFPKHRGQ